MFFLFGSICRLFFFAGTSPFRKNIYSMPIQSEFFRKWSDRILFNPASSLIYTVFPFISILWKRLQFFKIAGILFISFHFNSIHFRILLFFGFIRFLSVIFGFRSTLKSWLLCEYKKTPRKGALAKYKGLLMINIPEIDALNYKAAFVQSSFFSKLFYQLNLFLLQWKLNLNTSAFW